jgi:probable HAF family extracellular repeat protein
LLLLCLLPCLAHAGPQYSFTDLGPALTVGGLNDAGRVVGAVLQEGQQAPARLTGAVPELLAPTGRADAIQGQLIVGYAGQGLINQEAFLFTPQRGLTRLGLLPGGNASEATAVNPLALVVGYGDTRAGTVVPVVWWLGGRWQLPLPHGGDGHAYAVSPFGRIVGNADTATGDFHAMLWFLGQAKDLGTLGGPFSSAAGVIDAPVVVVGWSHTPTGMVGITWTPHDGMQALPALSPDLPYCDARALNQAGVIVGLCAPAGMGPSHAVAWRDRQILDLNTVGLPVGWVLETAMDINTAGQIAGIGRLSGQSRAWRLTPVPDRLARR